MRRSRLLGRAGLDQPSEVTAQDRPRQAGHLAELRQTTWSPTFGDEPENSMVVHCRPRSSAELAVILAVRVPSCQRMRSLHNERTGPN